MSEIVEIWKPVVGYESLYECSNLGRIKSLNRKIIRKNGAQQTFKEKILTPIEVNNYLYVCLYKNGKYQRKYVHRIICEAFLPNPENKPCVDHKNCVRSDNRLSNLRWVTYQENSENPISKKKQKENVPKSMLGKFGKNHPNSKPIIQIDTNGVFIKEWSCAAEVQRVLGFKKGYIGKCCKGKNEMAYGYKWKYKGVA